jgi:hypothetical protein
MGRAIIPVQMQWGWYVFEVFFNYTNQVGSPYNVIIKLDGITRVQLAMPTSTSQQMPFEGKLGYLDYGAGQRCNLDDIAINDLDGSRDTSWCGDGHVIALPPNGNSDSSQFVGSDSNSTDNYLLVDEFPATLTGGGGDYVESDASGAIDFYQTMNPNPTLKSNDAIQRVWVSATMRELSADGDTLQLGVKSGGSPVWSAPIPLGVEFREHIGDQFYTNPSTGQPWTKESLDTLQVGMKIP